MRRRDAIAGGLIASVALELGKRGFAAYLLKIPTYKAADRMAEERITAIGKLRLPHLGAAAPRFQGRRGN